MKIKLIKHVDLDELVDMINESIFTGYKMQGGIHSIVLANGIVYTQTMIKDE